MCVLRDIDSFALLSVFSVYVVTMKLSAGFIVLLAVFQLIGLTKARRVKAIIVYLILGLMTVLPFIGRNVILSGWLL